MRIPRAERRRRILAELEQAPSLRVGELAALLRVSTETIRRDFEALCAEGALSRTYGGAVRSTTNEPGVQERQGLFVEERRRMAHVATSLLSEAKLIFIGSGATTTHIARRIAAEMTDVTVVTHAFGVASVLALNPRIEVMLTPGYYHAGEGALRGAHTLRFLEDLHADWAILGASGLTMEGPSDALMDMAEVYAAMGRRARQRMVVADHSKHDALFPARYAQWPGIDVLVTDRAPSGLLARALATASVRVVAS
ncbi:MAG: DeoR/GlpR transcriptional regulator [Rhodobacteraceae bacterium]|nr:MAG: DeoR/GlpR transcriptional regulator [Paracoccaceae bacterium]